MAPRRRRTAAARRRTGRRPIEVRHGDTEQADALHGRQHQAHEFDARLLQQTVSCNRHRKTAASSNLAKVGEFDLHGDGSAECVRLFAPAPDFVCYSLDAGLDLIGCGEIPREGGLRAGGLTRAVGNDRAIVLAICDAEIPLGRFAKMALQEDERLCPQIRPRLDTELLHLCRGDRSNPVELADRQRRDEVGSHLRRDDELAIRLALAGRELGEELVVGDAGRCGETGLLENAPANLFRRGGRGLQAAQVLRDVEIGFIQRERFDQRCVMAEDRMDLRETAR